MKVKINTILASSSPRRLELLNLINIKPEVHNPQVKEEILSGEDPESFVSRIAVEKGKYIRKNNYSDNLIISADTIVLIENRMIGKPSGREDAFRMLEFLSGKIHKVITGVSLLYKDKEIIKNSVTEVKFSNITGIEINKYLDNESYMDKAGAYAIQGKASIFVEKISGCYFNVMGFPLNLFYSMIKILDISLEDL
ncbi:MAG: septum formation protein Maf [Candidatus Aminicenantes bacterium]|nr:septum formation protein Maf [Candidatus Aminicenantes bacterium]